MAAAAKQTRKRWRGLIRRGLRLTFAALPVILMVLPGTLPGEGSVRPRLGASEPEERASGSDELDIDRYPSAPDDDSDGERAGGRNPRSSSSSGGYGGRSSSPVIHGLTGSGIPEVALRAYRRAEQTLAVSDPSCGIRWSLLAAIGRVESNHGRYGGAQLRADGYGTRPIRGIPLDGRPGVATIRDSDNGALDGDAVYDRAIGPMQFIPSTWRSVAADGNADGLKDPDNIFDAAVGAATYLCAGDGNLRIRADRAAAVRRYNNSSEYVSTVLSLADAYESGQAGTLPNPGPATPVPPALPTPPQGPVNVGKPPAFPSGSFTPPPPPTNPPTTSRPPSTWPPPTGTTSSTSSSTTSSTTTSTTRPGCPTTTTTSSTSSTTTSTSSTTTTTVPPGCPTTTTTTTLPTTTSTAPSSSSSATSSSSSSSSSSASSSSAP